MNLVYIGYPAAILMGFSLGLLGGGGSILTVPILVYLFHIRPMVATSYSLFMVGAVALVGGFQYLRMNLVDFRTGVIFAIPALACVMVMRRYVVPALPQEIIQLGSFVVTNDLLTMVVFSLVMLGASYSMIWRKQPEPLGGKISAMKQFSWIGFNGLIVGMVTGFVGAGGGFLIVPALVMLTGVPMKTAVGTSLFVIAVNSLLGFFSGIDKMEEFSWPFLFVFVAISLVGLVTGTFMGKFVKAQSLKKGFGVFILIMGTFILIQQIFQGGSS